MSHSLQVTENLIHNPIERTDVKTSDIGQKKRLSDDHCKPCIVVYKVGIWIEGGDSGFGY